MIPTSPLHLTCVGHTSLNTTNKLHAEHFRTNYGPYNKNDQTI